MNIGLTSVCPIDIFERLEQTVANVVIITIIICTTFVVGIFILREQLEYRRRYLRYQEKFGEIR